MVKIFVVRSTLNKNKAKSLLELIIILIIVIATSIIFIKNYHINNNNLSIYKSTLQTLKYLLNLTRAEAVRLVTNTYLCPAKNGKCLGNWNHDIMIFAIDFNSNIKILHYFRDPFKIQKKFHLLKKMSFFGNNLQQKITFLPNGLTINNGHFCVDLKNLCCLYINQAGKIYIKILAED